MDILTIIALAFSSLLAVLLLSERTNGASALENEMPYNSNELLIRIQQEHGLVAAINENLILIGDSPYPMWSQVTNMDKPNGTTLIQLNIGLQVDPCNGRALLESFAGAGSSVDEAVRQAFGKFILNSLHVILAAFYDQPSPDIKVETWIINGQSYTVYLGNYGLQHPTGKAIFPPEKFFKTVEGHLMQATLGRTFHWCRTYFGHLNGKNLTYEAFLDNEPWVSLQQAMENLSWGSAEGFYSIRHFMILKKM